MGFSCPLPSLIEHWMGCTSPLSSEASKKLYFFYRLQFLLIVYKFTVWGGWHFPIGIHAIEKRWCLLWLTMLKSSQLVLLYAFWKTLNLVRNAYIGDLMSKKFKQFFTFLGLFFSMPFLVIGSFVFTAVVWIVQYPYFKIKNYLVIRKQEKKLN